MTNEASADLRASIQHLWKPWPEPMFLLQSQIDRVAAHLRWRMTGAFDPRLLFRPSKSVLHWACRATRIQLRMRCSDYSVRPSEWNYKLQNRMFSEGDCYQGLYSRAFGLWREKSKEAGFLLDTWDMHPLAEADVVWYNDLPHRRCEVIKAKAEAPHAKLVLQIFETPAVGLHFFDPANHRDFDAIVTYDGHMCDERRYFQYQIPNTVSRPVAKRPVRGSKSRLHD